VPRPGGLARNSTGFGNDTARLGLRNSRKFRNFQLGRSLGQKATHRAVLMLQAVPCGRFEALAPAAILRLGFSEGYVVIVLVSVAFVTAMPTAARFGNILNRIGPAYRISAYGRPTDAVTVKAMQNGARNQIGSKHH